MIEKIIIKGARENNLKNISLEIPRNELIVFTGVSGSGKSTLAFGTIFAEGQRRYVESLSSYARQFLGQSQKPDVESIDGLSPAISIDQKTGSHNPRSTVGTVTEIYDYLRLLFARVGIPYCPHCKKPIANQTIDGIVDRIKEIQEGEKLMILSPVVRGEKGAQQKLFEQLKKSGYARVMVDGNIYTLDEEIVLDKNLKHHVRVVVDRLVMKTEIDSRLAESIETSLKLSDGLVIVAKGEKFDEEELFSTNYACADCGWTLEEITPRLFSFNAPFGACPHCTGLGYTLDIDENLILKNKHLSVNGGAFNIAGWRGDDGSLSQQYFKAVADKYDIDLNMPLEELQRNKLETLLYGTGEEKFEIVMSNGRGFMVKYEGVVNNLRRRFNETKSEWARFEIGKFMREQECRVCRGKRLNEAALSVLIDKKDIITLTNMPVVELLPYFAELKLDKVRTKIAEPILKEINARLKFLDDVGLTYLTLARTAQSLSGGEAQRIRLATQIGSGLAGVLYILDEPSIGLHQRDNEKLLKTLFHLKELGNTLIVVEHDEDTIRAADYIVDIGPYAGLHGGEVVCAGKLKDIMACKKSITGQFLSGVEEIAIPKVRRKPTGELIVKGARQNNLQDIDVKIPLGVLTAVTGVSGSGKSSLVNGVLYPYLANELNRARQELGNVEKIEGVKKLDKVICIDQSPIGRTPRSNPATYTGVFTAIRDLFAATQESRARGYTSGRFSFNVKGGRCEACEGAGVKEIEMYFLPDITIPCDVCKGKRYNRETLEVRYKGKSISDVLDMTIEEAYDLFEPIPAIKNKIKALNDVGLGYMKLGQSATTLSGGEAQRVKLATELSKRDTGKTIYILDEPTTGLHMYDVKKLIGILEKLIKNGNSVVVIEHNLDVIKCADQIIDLGPEGGSGGGKIVAKGTPEEVAKVEGSYTGHFLKNVLK